MTAGLGINLPRTQFACSERLLFSRKAGASMAPPALRLNSGEQVLRDEIPSAFWTFLQYIPTFGLWAIWRGRHHFVLTNQRVMIVKGIVSKSEQSVPLGRIQDVNLQRSLQEGGYVRLSNSGGGLGFQRLGPLTVRRRGSLLTRSPKCSRHEETGYPRTERPRRLRAPQCLKNSIVWSGLRESGVLTDEEFVTQKGKLLGLAR